MRISFKPLARGRYRVWKDRQPTPKIVKQGNIDRTRRVLSASANSRSMPRSSPVIRTEASRPCWRDDPNWVSTF
jgi:hypothetical protein